MQVQRLRGISGFGWDDGTKLVVASDDQWAELAKACSGTMYSLDFVLTGLPQRGSKVVKWKTTPFPLYGEMHSLVDGIVATGSGAFQAGALPRSKPLATRNEPSTEWTENSQSTECMTPPQTPSDLNMACYFGSLIMS